MGCGCSNNQIIPLATVERQLPAVVDCNVSPDETMELWQTIGTLLVMNQELRATMGNLLSMINTNNYCMFDLNNIREVINKYK